MSDQAQDNGETAKAQRSGIPRSSIHKSRVAAVGTSGAMCSTGLITIAQQLPDGLWKQVLTIASPWLSLPITWFWYHGWASLRWRISDARNHNRLNRIDEITNEIIRNPDESAERKAWARKNQQEARAALLLLELRRLKTTVAEEEGNGAHH